MKNPIFSKLIVNLTYKYYISTPYLISRAIVMRYQRNHLSELLTNETNMHNKEQFGFSIILKLSIQEYL